MAETENEFGDELTLAEILERPLILPEEKEEEKDATAGSRTSSSPTSRRSARCPC
jgi:hypothetical protein